MGSRNLIIINPDGARLNPLPIELGEGPTGIALDESRSRIYVWNHFSSSISVVDSSAGTLITNVPVFNPTPEVVRKGRRHLYDARKTSGLGISACASCHVDARFDRLAWDLGNPAGSLTTNAGFVFHPMKGPMVTQTLQDIITPTNYNGATFQQASLHWRGDRKGIEDFNPTFTNLQANDVVLTTNEMAEFKTMLSTIAFPPNFRRNFDNSLPASVPLPGLTGAPGPFGLPPQPLPPGRPASIFGEFTTRCAMCHNAQSGRNIQTNDVTLAARSGTEGGFKFAQLRSVADKLGVDGSTNNGRAGFGFMHDGRVDTVTHFLSDGFGTFFVNDQQIADAVALLLCFAGSDLAFFGNPSGPSLDVPAAAGHQVTFASATPPLLFSNMYNLALQAGSRLELVIRGKRAGVARQWLLRHSTQQFQPDRNQDPAVSLTDVISSVAVGNEYTATLVPEGIGTRFGLDRDGDGFFDTTEAEAGTDPADASSYPFHLSVSKTTNQVKLAWQSFPGAFYTLEWATNWPLSHPSGSVWNVLAQQAASSSNTTTYTDAPPDELPKRFYRIRLEQ
jgi:hypothetical protein